VERPDLQTAIEAAQKTLLELEPMCEKLQMAVAHSRLSMAAAAEMNAGQLTFDQVVKYRLFDESTYTAFAKVVELRTHLDIAKQALTMAPKVQERSHG
jgi:hypothetical protein